MSDLRLQLLDSGETAVAVGSVDLNGEETEKLEGLRVGQHLALAVTKELLPDVSLEYLGETHRSYLEGETDVDEREVSVGARCRVAAAQEQNAAQALIPLLQWVELALLGVDFTLGGVASLGRLDRIQALEKEEVADDFVGCRMVFVFTVPTKRADPRQAP